jgi:hypothetical protein
LVVDTKEKIAVSFDNISSISNQSIKISVTL